MFVDPLSHLLIVLRRDVVEAFWTALWRAEPDLAIRRLSVDNVGSVLIADLHGENAILRTSKGLVTQRSRPIADNSPNTGHPEPSPDNSYSPESLQNSRRAAPAHRCIRTRTGSRPSKCLPVEYELSGKNLWAN